jgi:hypothetical protein
MPKQGALPRASNMAGQLARSRRCSPAEAD